MVEREPPYPPPPRAAPAGLGRDPGGSVGRRAVGLLATLFGAGLFYAVPVLLGGAAVVCLVAEEARLILRIGGFLVLSTAALFLLKAYLPRRLPAPVGLIPADDQETLVAFVNRVAEDVEAPPPRRIILAPTTRLKLSARLSPFALVRPVRWDLHVGLWLVYGVTLSEFQALVARTLAPLSRGFFERFRFNVRALLTALVDGTDLLDEVVETRPPSLPVGLARLVRGVSRGLAYPLRLLGRVLLWIDRTPDVFLADDLVAVRVAGSDALVHAVLRADFAGLTLREIDTVLGEAAELGIVTADLYAHMGDAATAVREAHNDFTFGEAPVLRGPTAGKYADVFEPGARYHSLVWTGFPSPDVREQAAKHEFVAAERDDRPAADLLDDPPPLRGRLTGSHYTAGIGRTPDVIPLPPETVRRWLRSNGGPAFPAACNGCFDGDRLLQPGTAGELDAALAAEDWDDGRLLSTASGLYANAGERAATWEKARRALDKLMRRTRYQPAGRDRALADDLADDVRKARKWLAALDKWAYVVHVHMAARLTDLAAHDDLLARYESVLRFQPLMDEARETRGRLDAFVRRLDEFDGPAPYRLVRDARMEFADARKNLHAYLGEAARIRDPLLEECTGPVALAEFLYARDGLPRKSEQTAETGRRLFFAWAEVAAKAAWLHRNGVVALLDLHARVVRDFGAKADVVVADILPDLAAHPVPTAIVQAVSDDPIPPERALPIVEVETDVPALAEDLPVVELESDPPEADGAWWSERPA